MKKEIEVIEDNNNEKLINCISKGIELLEININNVVHSDIRKLENYIRAFYSDAPLFRFVLFGYKNDKKLTVSSYIGNLDRYELHGCSIGGGCSFSSSSGVTTKYKQITWGLDGSKSIN